jgi:hypothetical protein
MAIITIDPHANPIIALVGPTRFQLFAKKDFSPYSTDTTNIKHNVQM